MFAPFERFFRVVVADSRIITRAHRLTGVTAYAEGDHHRCNCEVEEK